MTYPQVLSNDDSRAKYDAKGMEGLQEMHFMGCYTTTTPITVTPVTVAPITIIPIAAIRTVTPTVTRAVTSAGDELHGRVNFLRVALRLGGVRGVYRRAAGGSLVPGGHLVPGGSEWRAVVGEWQDGLVSTRWLVALWRLRAPALSHM